MFSEWSQAADSEKLSCVIAEAALPGQPVDVAAEDAWEVAVSVTLQETAHGSRTSAKCRCRAVLLAERAACICRCVCL